MKTAQPVCSAFVATTGTGKTTKVLELAKRLGGRILVIIDDESVQGWDHVKLTTPTKKGMQFKGIRKIYFDDTEGDPLLVWEMIYKYFREGNLILDDAYKFVNTDMRRNGHLKKILAGLRHLSFDVFFIAHQFDHLPPKMWGYVHYIYMSTITTLPKKSQVLVANPKKLIDTILKVNDTIDKAQRKGKETWGQFYCYKNI